MTKGYGFTVDDIDQSCFADLEPYEKAYKQEMIEQDSLQHVWWGNYGLSAVSVAVEHCLAGSKAQSEYTKKPIFDALEQNRELTEEEKQREVDRFFKQEDARLMNWKRNKRRKEMSNNGKV